jgi:hypothetical protein
MVSARFEIVWRHLLELDLQTVEVLDIGAEDLDPPLFRLKQLPGAGGGIPVSLDETAQVDSEPLELRTMILTKVGADRREIPQAVRPDPHSHECVGGRSTEGIEERAAIGQDDVVDDQPGIGDVVGLHDEGDGVMGSWGVRENEGASPFTLTPRPKGVITRSPRPQGAITLAFTYTGTTSMTALLRIVIPVGA